MNRPEGLSLRAKNLSIVVYYFYDRPTDWPSWESFIIHLGTLSFNTQRAAAELRIFHYSPWYTYLKAVSHLCWVENLSLFTLVHLFRPRLASRLGWESFIIHLGTLSCARPVVPRSLRIFHYSPWYTYLKSPGGRAGVENLSLFALIYLPVIAFGYPSGWESFIIRLDILKFAGSSFSSLLRIFHYSPWYT